ncbi:hypothetical protein F511_39714 [Dorcoceras hygrometricum]|uniref:Uncharacterized protein n=1 Tax=Dorcoceras hygrometricum TaxID=472368 RepID=A0A2Z7ATD0_9LAMI|nr:hypothetical protein F511_39714 [Dorcoceras hygrometricum]
MRRVVFQVLQLVVVLTQLVVPQEGAESGHPAVQGAQSSQSSKYAHQPQQQQQQLAQQSGR